MRTMSVTELRSDWGRVSREVEFGAVVRITRRGRPIARLSSATEANDEEAGEGGRSVSALSDSGSKRRTDEIRQIGSTEFQARIAEVLRWVEAGETVLITRHGRVALRLAPEEDAEHEARSRAMDRFEQYLSRKKRIRMTLPEMLAARREGLS